MGHSMICVILVAGKYGAKRAVQEALEKTGLGHMYVTSYCLTSFWGPGLGMLGRAEPPVEAVEVLGDGTAKGESCIQGDCMYKLCATWLAFCWITVRTL